MAENIQQTLKTLIRNSNPVALAAAAAAHVLGVSMASYLAEPVQWTHFFWSLLFVLSLHLFTQWIIPALFPAPSKQLATRPQSRKNRSGPLLYASMFTLALLGTSLSGFLISGGIPPVSWLLAGLLLLSNFAYAFSPGLRTSGVGEVWAAFMLAGLIPAFSFSLMTGYLHRLLPMSTTALASFWFAYQLITQLKTYAADSALERKNITTRFGWQKAMVLHDASLQFGVSTLILAFLLGYSSRITLSLLIVLPLIITQLIHMNRIRRGAPPRFALMEWTAAAVFFLTMYLQMLGFLRY